MQLRVLILLLTTASATWAADIEPLLSAYRGEGVTAFSAQDGEALWHRSFPGEQQPRSCVSCHGKDLTQSGEHVTTGKSIKPLAPSANPERLGDPAKVEKWFMRNCKWTFGRTCTAQEKGDFLVWINGQ